MSFKKFLLHYVNEAGAVVAALGSIASGIALPNSERDKVNNAIETLSEAVTNILAGIDKVADTTVKISKADVKAAVAEVLPSVLDDVVTKAVVAALAAEKAKDAAGDA